MPAVVLVLPIMRIPAWVVLEVPSVKPAHGRPLLHFTEIFIFRGATKNSSGYVIHVIAEQKMLPLASLVVNALVSVVVTIIVPSLYFTQRPLALLPEEWITAFSGSCKSVSFVGMIAPF
jgi:hypothetical protein